MKLDEADRLAELSDVRYTHDEVFGAVRNKLNEKYKVRYYLLFKTI